MANPYIGQVSPFAFPYAPVSWAFCDGSNLPINQYGTLFSLLGTVFGGNGSTQFAIPNLGGSSPCGTGAGPGLTQRTLGQGFGTSTVTLDQTTMPAHTHTGETAAYSPSAPAVPVPTAVSALTVASANLYTDGGANAVMSPSAISPSGSGAAHNNMQPYLGINYCIALLGQYPYFD